MPASPHALRAKALGFVLYFTVATLLLPQAVHWDGLGFIAWSADPLQLDYGHLLYVPLLRVTRVLLSPLGDDAVRAAQLASVLGAALSFVLLWSRFERVATRNVALTGALLVATTPLFWNQGGTVEPSTLILAALLVAANAAERYGRTKTALDASLFSLAALALFGLHVVSVFALPWLFFLARGEGDRPPLRHALIPIGFVAGTVLSLVLLGHGAALQKVPDYWRGFLPRFAGTDALDHATRGATLAFAPTEGFPVLTVALLVACVLALRTKNLRGEALWLGAPYLCAFLVLGKPLVGLLLPVTIAAGLLIVSVASDPGAPRRRTAAMCFAVVVLVQICGTLASGLARHALPDERRVQAELFAAALPAGSTMIVGPIGHHLTWYTEADAVILPDEIHEQGITTEADALAFVVELAQREAAEHTAVYITSEAIEYLDWRWRTDGLKLPLLPERRVLVRAKPELSLLPLAVSSN